MTPLINWQVAEGRARELRVLGSDAQGRPLRRRRRRRA